MNITTHMITIESPFTNNYVSIYTHILKFFYKMLITPIFKKIKFKGKGYYLYKSRRGSITPQFGYSHRLYLYTFFTNVSFLNKTSLIIFGSNIKDILLSSKTLYKWRPLNIFTGRGVRFSRQIVYKKSGKVSSYR